MEFFLSEKDIQMVNKHMKRCSMLQIIMEIQIKITMNITSLHLHNRYLKKKKNNKCWQGCEKIELLCTAGNVKLGYCYWKQLWQFFKKLKIELLYHLAIPFLDCIKKNWILSLKEIFAKLSSQKHYIQERATQVSTDGQNVVYTHKDYYSPLKRKGILTWYNMDETWGH